MSLPFSWLLKITILVWHCLILDTREQSVSRDGNITVPYRPVPIDCSVIFHDINKHASSNLTPQSPLQFSLLAQTKVFYNSCYKMLCPRSNRIQTRDFAHVISMLNHQISQLARSLDKIFIAREMSLTGSASIQLDSHTNPTWPAPGVNANKARQKWRVERVRDNGAAVTVCCEVLQKQISLSI